MGHHSIFFKGIMFDCNVSYQPAEKQTHDYPGCAEEWEITNVNINGDDASELLESMIEEFEEEVIKQLKDEY